MRGSANVSPRTANQCSNFRVLRVAQLYAGRGDAHSDVSGITVNPRDCVHWCVSGGVLDALAMATLSDVLDLSNCQSQREGNMGTVPRPWYEL